MKYKTIICGGISKFVLSRKIPSKGELLWFLGKSGSVKVKSFHYIKPFSHLSEY